MFILAGLNNSYRKMQHKTSNHNWFKAELKRTKLLLLTIVALLQMSYDLMRAGHRSVSVRIILLIYSDSRIWITHEDEELPMPKPFAPTPIPAPFL